MIMNNEDTRTMTQNNEYMVSVYMTTYFHECYVEKAIESILAQKVNFQYEIVISDDASQDATPEILNRFAATYPFIKINLNETNIGLSANMFKAKLMCSGKYLIPLSGDDYWIDDKKLQKQVDFLEVHKEFIGVATRIESRTEDSLQADFIVPTLDKCNRAFSLNDFLKGVNFPTNGLLMRNIIKSNRDYFSLMPKMSPFIDDETDCLLILRMGDVYIMDDSTVAYRRRIEKEGEHNFNSIHKGISKFEKHIALLNNLYKEFGDECDLFGRYKIALGPELAKHYRKSTKDRFKEILNTIPEEYLKRGLIIKSIIYDIPKAYEVLTRSHRK